MGCINSRSNDDKDMNLLKKIDLNEPYDLNGLKLENRFVMGPMTRCRTNPETGVANELVAEYYEQRAGFGLILTECSQISPLSNAFPGSCGIYNKEQMEGWKKVVDRVHKKGGKIIIQIWHSGRQTSSENIGGVPPLAPSAIPVGQDDGQTKKPYPMPKEMTKNDIKEVVEQFKNAAVLSKQAGFDGIQIHGANGYLVDQFWRDGTNQRTDEYGGSFENRCRFMMEIIEAISQVYEQKRLSIRLTPTGRFGNMFDSNPEELTKYTLEQLSKLDLHFVEFKKHGNIDKFKVSEKNANKDDKGQDIPDIQMPEFYKSIRKYYKGTLMGNGELTPTTAEQGIENNQYDIPSFASLAISNPDLPLRHKNKWELNTNIDWSTAFGANPPTKGYTDYMSYDGGK